MEDVYRILLCGGIGNDIGGIFIYDLNKKGPIELDMIPGFIKKIDAENGELLIRDRKQLLRLEFVQAYYSIREDGDLIRDRIFFLLEDNTKGHIIIILDEGQADFILTGESLYKAIKQLILCSFLYNSPCKIT